ncbi:MAG: hypothetical protein CBC68_00495 [Candidatus Marinimicrobia bacterium TMED108]|nr:MAG: hypothetical protein CBC68_04265 [Candidatus Marinimicrobia bacterium TMED108]OUV43204.1 MAG: hypothetical protein CBC68_00495 [Candidatus Marinimicrobia bacterium TMED108]
MAKQKKTSRKTTVKKVLAKKVETKKASPKKRMPRKAKEPKLSFELNVEGRLMIERLKKWTRFVGIMNIVTGIIYCLTIFILSIPTVIMGVVTIFMGTKLTIAANHLEFAESNSDSKSFQIAIDQIQRYFLINGALFIVTLVFLLLILVMVSLFASVFIEFWNSQNFNYSISLIDQTKQILN